MVVKPVMCSDLLNSFFFFSFFINFCLCVYFVYLSFSCIFQDRNLQSLGQPQDCSPNVLRVQTGLFVLFILRSCLEESIREDHWPELEVSVIHEPI